MEPAARATVERRLVGAIPSRAGRPPEPVHAHVLRAGALAVEVWSYGATLVRVDVPDRTGAVANVVLAGPDLADRIDPTDRGGYPGATIGRYANRIRDGRFRLDGIEHRLATNDGSNHLHGGVVGFDQHVWDAEAVADDDAATVTLRRASPDGEEGYPGTLDVQVRYALDPGALTIDYEARTDRPTIVGLTNHAYWNLAGGGSVEAHRLRIDADRYLPTDATQIPVGERAPVAGTRFDLRTPTVLADRLGTEGIDHCYLLASVGDPQVELSDPASGRFLQLTTDQPALQLYTADHLGRPRQAVCLETQIPPDSPNQPELGVATLRPGEVYRHRTRHVLGARAAGEG